MDSDSSNRPTQQKPRFEFKIVVAGPFAAGKTTLITATVDGDLIGTEAPTSGPEREVKKMTTVGMEYGTLVHDSDDFSVELNVYGVPGQSRFSFMWDVVAVGMDGLLVLVDADRPETWENSREILDYFARLSRRPTIIGVNRATDRPDVLDAVRRSIGADVPMIALDVVDPVQSRDAMVELLFLMLDELDEGVDDDPDGVADHTFKTGATP